MAFPTWLIGVGLAVIASLVSNLGLNLQKKSHLNNSKLETTSKSKPSTRHARSGSSSSSTISLTEPARKDSFPDSQSTRVPPNTILVKQYSDQDVEVDDTPKKKKKGSIFKRNEQHERERLNGVSHQNYGGATINSESYVNYDDDVAPIQESSSRSNGAHSKSSSSSKAPTVSYTRQPLWQLGIFCVVAGSLCDFAALAFADQSVIAPLGSLTLVANVFFAPLLLKEKVTRRDIICTIVIVGGSALAVAFASHDDKIVSTEEMFQLFLNYRFVAYAIVVVVILAALRIANYRITKLRKRAKISREDAKRYASKIRIHQFSYAACAGIVGAQSVLFAKCTSNLLRSTIAGEGIMFVYFGTYLVLLGLFVTIYFQIRWLNSGLRVFSALYIVPVFQSFWILVSVLSGMVFFQEYEGVFDNVLNAVCFPVGLCATIVGVYFLSQKVKNVEEHGPKEVDYSQEDRDIRRFRRTSSGGDHIDKEKDFNYIDSLKQNLLSSEQKESDYDADDSSTANLDNHSDRIKRVKSNGPIPTVVPVRPQGQSDLHNDRYENTKVETADQESAPHSKTSRFLSSLGMLSRTRSHSQQSDGNGLPTSDNEESPGPLSLISPHHRRSSWEELSIDTSMSMLPIMGIAAAITQATSQQQSPRSSSDSSSPVGNSDDSNSDDNHRIDEGVDEEEEEHDIENQRGNNGVPSASS